MTDVPAMCAGCGDPLGFDALRIQAITPEGRVDLQHERDAGRCGPVIVAALAAAAPDDGHRNPGPLLRRLEQTLATHAEALALLPKGDAPIDLFAMVDAYERRLVGWALERSGGRIAGAARRLSVSWFTLYKRLRVWSTRGVYVWTPRRWSSADCEAAVLGAVAAGHVTADAVIAAVVAPGHLSPHSKSATIRRALRRLAATGVLVRVNHAARRGTPFRYALPSAAERGAA